MQIERRRALLAGTAALAWLALKPAVLLAAEGLSLEAFLALSRHLTEQEDLDPGLGRDILAAFEALGQGPALEDLAAGGDSQGKLAQAVVLAWYSGSVTIAGDRRVVAYEAVLEWRAMDFTKPPGFCGAGFGSWAESVTA